jgi:hypothetical protein
MVGASRDGLHWDRPYRDVNAAIPSLTREFAAQQAYMIAAVLDDELNMGTCVRLAQDAASSRSDGATGEKAFRMSPAPRLQLSTTEEGGSAGALLGLIGLLIDARVRPWIPDFGPWPILCLI